jgi:putative FmdB family regulatory protein
MPPVRPSGRRRHSTEGAPVPTYQYACTECGEQLEKVQKFSDDPLTVCPNCNGRLRKVFSPVGIVFKGSGFYRTDSRSGPVAGGKDSNKDGASKDGGKEKAESGSKSESSSGDKSRAKSDSSGTSSSKDSGSSSSSSGKSSGSTSEKVA